MSHAYALLRILSNTAHAPQLCDAATLLDELRLPSVPQLRLLVCHAVPLGRGASPGMALLLLRTRLGSRGSSCCRSPRCPEQRCRKNAQTVGLTTALCVRLIRSGGLVRKAITMSRAIADTPKRLLGRRFDADAQSAGGATRVEARGLLSNVAREHASR